MISRNALINLMILIFLNVFVAAYNYRLSLKATPTEIKGKFEAVDAGLANPNFTPVDFHTEFCARKVNSDYFCTYFVQSCPKLRVITTGTRAFLGSVDPEPGAYQRNTCSYILNLNKIVDDRFNTLMSLRRLWNEIEGSGVKRDQDNRVTIAFQESELELSAGYSLITRVLM